jgi:lysozyme
MAKRSKMTGGKPFTAKRRRGAWPLRLAALALLVVLVGIGAAWWHMRHWLPSRAQWPQQGAQISAMDGPVDWTALKAIGADFVYLDATASAFAHDAAFLSNLDNARAARLEVGAVHIYDPCQPADKQAANFVTAVPRDAKLLAPAVELDRLADDCPMKVSEAAVESELMTFVNQVETHAGKPVILKVSARFENRYHIAKSLNRTLWLVRNRFAPDYAGRPWSLWTANDMLITDADARPLRWLVVQP